MKKEDKNMKGTDPESFEVGEFRPEDAEGIVKLFRSVYGEGYPVRVYYDPEALIAANRDDRIYSIVARTPSGDVIGVNHLVQSAPYPKVYENAAGLVRKDYRGSGAMTATLAYLYDDFTFRRPHIEELFGNRSATMSPCRKESGVSGSPKRASRSPSCPRRPTRRKKALPDGWQR